MHVTKAKISSIYMFRGGQAVQNELRCCMRRTFSFIVSFFLLTVLLSCSFDGASTSGGGTANPQTSSNIVYVHGNLGFNSLESEGGALPYEILSQAQNYSYSNHAELVSASHASYSNGSLAKKFKTLTFESPSSLRKIGDSAFDYCTVEGVSLPSTVIEIERGAFIYANVTSMTLSPNITIINDSTFSNNNFTEIVIPDGVTEIGYDAFWACRNLTTITLPASVTSIGGNAFGYCDSLVTVNYKGTEEQKNALLSSMGSGNEYLSNATWNCNYTGD